MFSFVVFLPVYDLVPPLKTVNLFLGTVPTYQQLFDIKRKHGVFRRNKIRRFPRKVDQNKLKFHGSILRT